MEFSEVVILGHPQECKWPIFVAFPHTPRKIKFIWGGMRFRGYQGYGGARTESWRTFPKCAFWLKVAQKFCLPFRKHSHSRGFWRDWYKVRIQVSHKYTAATQTPWSLWEVRYVYHLPPGALLFQHKFLPTGMPEVWMDRPSWACQDKRHYSNHHQCS